MSVEYGERITRVETRLAGVEEDVSVIKSQLNTVATKEDVQEVRSFSSKDDLTPSYETGVRLGNSYHGYHICICRGAGSSEAILGRWCECGLKT